MQELCTYVRMCVCAYVGKIVIRWLVIRVSPWPIAAKAQSMRFKTTFQSHVVSFSRGNFVTWCRAE